MWPKEATLRLGFFMMESSSDGAKGVRTVALVDLIRMHMIWRLDGDTWSKNTWMHTKLHDKPKPAKRPKTAKKPPENVCGDAQHSASCLVWYSKSKPPTCSWKTLGWEMM